MPARQPTILGIPLDVNSSYLRGPAAAPAKIREALSSNASNQWSEMGVDIEGEFADAGDLKLQNSPERVNADFGEITRAIAKLVEENRRPLSLGGDHSITYPIMQAIAPHLPDLTILHFDAHPDLYNNFEDNRTSHASPFARIMEEGLVKKLVQIGIRTLNGHQREQAERFGVQILHMSSLPAHDRLNVGGPVYISFDLDVLDPAYAPGVSHHEPGGMTVREAISHLHSIRGSIVGADIVEYNPARDFNGVTATVAAKILKEILGKMVVESGSKEMP